MSAGPEWVDTHCHLQMLDEPDAELVAEAGADGVATLVCVGIDTSTTAAAIEAARAFDGVHATAGLHPHEARHLDAQWDAIAESARAAEVVGIGECGFDFYRDHSPHDAQEAAFRAQIGLAKELGKVLVIHTRDAWDDAFRVLEDEGPPPRLVFHCFSGGPAEAARCVELGAVLSIAGPISYPRNDDLRDAARSVPLDRLVVETDAPFLSPQGYRGKTNYPARVALVGAALAEALGLAVADVAASTTTTARELFGLTAPAR